jgi:putative oxidoreductase
VKCVRAPAATTHWGFGRRRGDFQYLGFSFPTVRFHSLENSMNKLIFGLVQTSGSVGPLVLRVLLAVVMFPHGAQKVLGWFGGAGFTSVMQTFTDKMGIPAAFAVLAILTEFLGPIALFFGFLTRIAALAIGFDMLVAAILVHVHFGFFMNWSGKLKGEGIEYDLLLWAIALALIIQGAGALSLDRVISVRSTKLAPLTAN